MNRPGEKDVVGLDVQMDNVLAVYKFKTLQSKLTWIFLGHMECLGNMRGCTWIICRMKILHFSSVSR